MNSERTALIFCISLLFLLGSIFLFASEPTNEQTSEPTNNTNEQANNTQDELPLAEEIPLAEEMPNEPPQILPSNCDYSQHSDTYTIKAACVLQGQLPQLSIKEVVDLLRDDIITFTEIYQPFKIDATYYGGQPIYKTPNTSLLNGSFEANQQLIQLAKQGKEIGFTKTELAHYRASQLSFYVSDKDISQLSRCNTQNYTLALKTLDGKLLQPNESFNANRELAKVSGYCTGRGEKNFLFYGGVCGMTAQVFRTALIHPSIAIVKRRPHNERFVQYYGAEVGGDDAAVYEMSKQFEIKNIGTNDMYFKVKREKQHNLLVAISPKNNQQVQLTKFPIHSLKIDLERIIWENTSPIAPALPTDNLLPGQEIPPTWFGINLSNTRENGQTKKIISQETFHSTYIKKNYELR